MNKDFKNMGFDTRYKCKSCGNPLRYLGTGINHWTNRSGQPIQNEDVDSFVDRVICDTEKCTKEHKSINLIYPKRH